MDRILFHHCVAKAVAAPVCAVAVCAVAVCAVGAIAVAASASEQAWVVPIVFLLGDSASPSPAWQQCSIAIGSFFRRSARCRPPRRRGCGGRHRPGDSAGIDRIELHWNTSGIDDVVIRPSRDNGLRSPSRIAVRTPSRTASPEPCSTRKNWSSLWTSARSLPLV